MASCKRIYCIAGMGADERIFSRLSVDGYELVYVPWAPLLPKDTLASYAKKMSDKIPGDSPLILGMSFGGMVAVEVGKLRPVEKIILVSSARDSSQLPRISKLPFGAALLDGTPGFLYKTTSRITNWFIGARTPDEHKLLDSMILDAPPDFIRLALKCVIGWHNHNAPGNIFQVHGTKDNLILPANVHPDHWVKGGTHLIVYTHAAEVGSVIAAALK